MTPLHIGDSKIMSIANSSTCVIWYFLYDHDCYLVLLLFFISLVISVTLVTYVVYILYTYTTNVNHTVAISPACYDINNSAGEIIFRDFFVIYTRVQLRQYTYVFRLSSSNLLLRLLLHNGSGACRRRRPGHDESRLRPVPVVPAPVRLSRTVRPSGRDDWICGGCDSHRRYAARELRDRGYSGERTAGDAFACRLTGCGHVDSVETIVEHYESAHGPFAAVVPTDPAYPDTVCFVVL